MVFHIGIFYFGKCALMCLYCIFDVFAHAVTVITVDHSEVMLDEMATCSPKQ